jgi:hypothetical protein
MKFSFFYEQRRKCSHTIVSDDFFGSSVDVSALGRPRRRWEDGIKIDLREIGWGGDWIHLAQDRDRWRAVVYAVMNLRVLAPRS